MVLGLSTSGAIKIKTDGEAGLRAVECACCNSPIVCGLFAASNYQNYFDNANNLPPEIYIGGKRIYINRNLISAIPTPPPIAVSIWQGVNDGTLFSRNGTQYGDTNNGIKLEPEGDSYVWAVYKNTVRSTALYLVDNVNRHDNYASAYLMTYNCPDMVSTPIPLQETIYRVGCDIWGSLNYMPEIPTTGGGQTGIIPDDIPSWLERPQNGFYSGSLVSISVSLGGEGPAGCKPYYQEYPYYDPDSETTKYEFVHGCISNYSFQKSTPPDGNGLTGDYFYTAYGDETPCMTIS
jgi:hypothetical protein